MALLFGDISYAQPTVDWAKVNLPLVFLKACEGTNAVDSTFVSHRAGAHGQGIPYGAYHFLRAGQGAAQCAHFLAVTGDLRQYIGFMLDIERGADGLIPSKADVTAFVNAWKAATSLPLFQYGPKGILAATSGSQNGPLWLADYPGGGYPGDNYPIWNTAFNGWSSPTLWQFGPLADPGFPRTIDGDAFRGTLDQLISLMQGENVQYELKVERWLLDGGPQKVTSMGAPIVATVVDYSQRLVITSQPGAAYLRLTAISRTRLTAIDGDVSPADDAVTASFTSALLAFELPASGLTQAQLDAAVAAQKSADDAALAAAVAAQKATDDEAEAQAVAQAAADQKAKSIAAVQAS